MEPRNEDINAKKIISVEDAITKLGKARLEVFRPARIRTLTSAPEGGGGGGTPGNSWWGCAAGFSKS